MRAVIIAGGQGTRFWPLSRRSLPKQFLSLGRHRTLLQDTVTRLIPLVSADHVFVVCSHRYASVVREQLPELADGNVIEEPVGRNTAPAIGLAALHLSESGFQDEVMVVLPSDHLITRLEEFHGVLGEAQELARDGWLVTFGIQPTHPATGYGYLERGDDLADRSGAFEVRRFVEKPDLPTATGMLRHGGFFWNSGMFAWKSSEILRQIERLMPELWEGLMRIRDAGMAAETVAEVFPTLPSISIDVGVMEKASRVAAIGCDLGWSDLGSWRSVKDLTPRDEAGNSISADNLFLQSQDNLVIGTPGKMTAILGMEGLVVVDTPDALLICPVERSEEVKQLVDEIASRGLDDYL